MISFNSTSFKILNPVPGTTFFNERKARVSWEGGEGEEEKDKLQLAERCCDLVFLPLLV